jgi:hypothetical protein
MGRHATSMGRMRNACNILIEKSKETAWKSLGADDIIKINLNHPGCDSVHSFHVAQNRFQWWD